jgi:Cellulase (glycosyl hydrolase family 5)
MISPTWCWSSRLVKLPLVAATLSLWLHPILFVGCCWSNNSPNLSEQLQVAKFKVCGRWIVDQYGRVRLFHGFNSVLKGPPFIDYEIFNRTRLDLYRQWGFNVVRLGTMWTGAQPTNAYSFNETYLTELLDAVRLLAEYDIFVIMDMHQVYAL